MSEEQDSGSNDNKPTPSSGEDSGAAQVIGQVRLERLYLKDCSFESPNSPSVVREEWKPEIDLEINNRSHKVAEDRFEVVLTVTVKARQPGERTAFIIEVQQAAIFVISGLEERLIHQVLGTVCPNTLFPYIREAVDSLVVRGGFPALQLAPVNFDAAYEEAMKRQSEKPIEH